MKSDLEARNQELTDGLRTVLADTYALYQKTLVYHWNVEGVGFPYLHKLFEKQYETLFLAVDEVAERIRTVGGYLPGRHDDLIKGASIVSEEAPRDALEMIRVLREDYMAACQTLRTVIGMVQRQQDEASATLLSDQLLNFEKAAWMLKSCLVGQEKAAVEGKSRQVA